MVTDIRGKGFISVNTFKAKFHVIKSGILPWVYGELEHNITCMNNVISEAQFLCVFKVSSRERERAYVFSVLIESLYKNKIILNYKSPSSRSRISTTMGISEKTYYRNIQLCLELGFCVKDGEHLRFVSHRKIIENINLSLGETFKEHYQLDYRSADIEISSRDFETCKLFLRLVFIKYAEHRNLLKVSKNIRRANSRKFLKRNLNEKFVTSKVKIKNGSIFIHNENNISKGKPYYRGTALAEVFKNVYEFLYIKTRKHQPNNLSIKYVIGRNIKEITSSDKNEKFYDKVKEVSGRKRYFGDMNRFEYHSSDEYIADRIIAERKRKRNEKIDDSSLEQNQKEVIKSSSLDDNFVDFYAENVFTSGVNETTLGIGSSSNILINGGRKKFETIKPNFPVVETINNLDISNLNKGLFTMSLKELQKLLSKQIFSPIDYYTFLNSEFNSEFRFGLSKMSKMFGLSRSQCSKMMMEMEKKNILIRKRRFVFITTVNGASKNLLSSLAKEFSLINEENPLMKSKAFDRIIFHKGCLLYELEANKQNIPFISMRTEAIHENIKVSDELLVSNRYKRLQKSLNEINGRDKKFSTEEER